MYALKTKRRFEFICICYNIITLEKLIAESFYNWADCQPKGSEVTIEDYLENKERVKITIQKI